MRRLNPNAIHPPFANYAHGVEVDPGARYVFCAGQLGVGRDGSHFNSTIDQVPTFVAYLQGKPKPEAVGE